MAERNITNRYEALLIGGSAGSLEVLLQLIPTLPPSLDLALIIVLHRKSGESVLAELLNNRTNWTVKEAEEKEIILPGTMYIAPADYHLIVEQDRSFSLDYSEKVHYSRPAIDVTFETAADAYAGNTIGLLLSGANSDGTAGLQKIKAAGGLTIVQDPAEATVDFMPKQAIQAMRTDYVATTPQILEILMRITQ